MPKQIRLIILLGLIVLSISWFWNNPTIVQFIIILTTLYSMYLLYQFAIWIYHKIKQARIQALHNRNREEL